MSERYLRAILDIERNATPELKKAINDGVVGVNAAVKVRYLHDEKSERQIVRTIKKAKQKGINMTNEDVMEIVKTAQNVKGAQARKDVIEDMGRHIIAAERSKRVVADSLKDADKIKDKAERAKRVEIRDVLLKLREYIVELEKWSFKSERLLAGIDRGMLEIHMSREEKAEFNRLRKKFISVLESDLKRIEKVREVE